MEIRKVLIQINKFDNMKTKFQILALIVFGVVVASCEKHDFFDENTITGAVGPEAYWEIASSAVKAGESMEFTAQYYSSTKAISHSEAWYSLSKTVSKTVNCSWLSHSHISSIKSQERVLQFIKEYPHAEELWSDSLHAYTFTDAFPVSGTLAPVAWVRPTTFDPALMVNYFGENFMKEFKDEVKEKMTWSVYNEKYVSLGYMEDFKLYTDSSYDWNISSDSVEAKYYHFPLDSAGNVAQWVVDSMNYYWDQITFEQLILAADGTYDVSYNRNYSLDAELRVYDVENVYSKTTSKEVVVN